MDPWGSCRAMILPARLTGYTGAVELSLVPCSWTLQYVCMEYNAAKNLSAGLTLPHNMYRTPSSPALPPPVPYSSGGGTGGLAAGYRLVRSGVKLGYAVPPDGALAFSSFDAFLRLGPVVNLLGRWRGAGLDALRVVNAGDTTNVVELALADNDVPNYFGDPNPVASAVWAASPLPREPQPASVLHTSYIRRVEGCSSGAAVQRLIHVNAEGATAGQGVVRCIGHFAEEVVPGGFLASVEGFYLPRNPNATGDAAAAPSIVQLVFVWAVPENYTTVDPGLNFTSARGGVRAVAPRLSPLTPRPQCSEARATVPASAGIRGRAECGQFSTEGFSCPSYMCCGAARGRVGLCGTLASSCLLSSCDPSFGLCGVVPSDSFEVSSHEGIMGVAPAVSPLSSPPPYTVSLDGPDAEVATTTVRLGSSVYLLDKSATFQYASAMDACKAHTLFGLSWRLASVADAFAFEVSLLARTAFLSQLDNRVVWVRPRPDSVQLSVQGCLTVSWNVDSGSVQLVAVQAADCATTASVICKADWPVAGTNCTGDSCYSYPRNFSAGSSTATSVNGTARRWTPGLHSLSYNYIGSGTPNSGSSCAFNSFGALQSLAAVSALANTTAAKGVGDSSTSSSAPMPLGVNATLSSTIAAVATRPLLVWSNISSEAPTAYEVTGAIALQYTTPPLLSDSSAADLAPPMLLGSLDGTYLAPDSPPSYPPPPAPAGVPSPSGNASTAGIEAYVSRAAGWRGLQLDAAAGEAVVLVAGCRGAFLEQLVLHTSLGRVWSTPMGLGLSCSVPFRYEAPSGGYLVALQVYAGYYVEEVSLVWGTPVGPSPPPPPAQLAAARGSRPSLSRPAVIGISVSLACGIPLLVLGLATAWWLRQRRRAHGNAAAAAPGKAEAQQASPGGGADEGSSELSSAATGADGRPPSSGDGQGPGAIPLNGRAEDAAAALAGAPSSSPYSGTTATNTTISSGAVEVPCSLAGAMPATAGTAAGLAPDPAPAAIDASGGAGSRTLGLLAPGAAHANGPLPLVQGPGGRLGAPGNAIRGSLPHAGISATVARPLTGHSSDHSSRQGYAPGERHASALVSSDGAAGARSVTGSDATAPLGVAARQAVGATGPTAQHQCEGSHGFLGSTDGSGRQGPTGHSAGPPLTPPPSSQEQYSGSALQPPPPLWTMPATAFEVGLPPPPAGAAGPDAEAWAQELHAALFHKVLYQWQPPALGIPVSGSGHPPARQPAQLAGPGVGSMSPVSAAGSAVLPAAHPLPSPLPGAPGQGLPLAAAAAVQAADRRRAAPSLGLPASSGGVVSLSSSSQTPSTGAQRSPAEASGSGVTTRTAMPVGANALPVPPSPLPTGTTSSGLFPGSSSRTHPSARSHGATAAGAGTSSAEASNASGATAGGGAAAAAAATSASAGSTAASGGSAGVATHRIGSSNAAAALAAAAVAAAAGAGAEGRTGSSGTAAAAAAASASSLDAAQIAAALAAGLGGPHVCGPGLLAQQSATELLLGRDVLVDADDPSTYLGHGTSGVVRRGMLRQEDGSWRLVAVKLLNRPSDQAVDAYRKHLKTLLQEMTILGSLRHPNIVQLLGGSVSLHSGGSFLVEELCGRTLSHAIYDETTPYSLPLVLRWCADVAAGLAYLHPNIVHRDLKPSNVLLDAAGTAKISDFGLARFKLHTTLITRDAEVGTTCYMSPECFVSNDFKVTAACDVYSLGVLMNEMVTRMRPWSGVRTAVVGFKVAVVGDRPKMASEGHPMCPQGLRELIQACWAQQPEERPSSAEVLARLHLLIAQADAEEAAAEGAAVGHPAGMRAGGSGEPGAGGDGDGEEDEDGGVLAGRQGLLLPPPPPPLPVYPVGASGELD